MKNTLRPLFSFRSVGRSVWSPTRNLSMKLKSGNPVAVGCVAMTLNVVLTAGKVPQEVSPVHEVYLVVDEETHILYEGGFTHGAAVYLHRFSLEARPLLVGSDVAAVGAVHAGEEHAEFGRVDVVAFAVDDFVAVGLVFRRLITRAHTGAPSS